MHRAGPTSPTRNQRSLSPHIVNCFHCWDKIPARSDLWDRRLLQGHRSEGIWSIAGMRAGGAQCVASGACIMACSQQMEQKAERMHLKQGQATTLKCLPSVTHFCLLCRQPRIVHVLCPWGWEDGSVSEDLSLDLQHTYKKLEIAGHACGLAISALGGRDKGIARANWLAREPIALQLQ